jgi:hypothetical protein
MILGRNRHRGFFVAAALFAGLTALFLIWVSLHLGGARVSDAADDVGELVAALVASAACLAAARMQRRVRAGWGFLSASSLAWACGEAAWCYYDLIRGVVVPFPSWADVGFLAAMPLAGVGLLAFAETHRSTRQLAVLAAEVSGGLGVFFASWLAVGLLVAHRPLTTVMSPVVSMAYPVGDLVTALLVLVAFRRATRDRFALGLILAGILSFTIADTSFSYFIALNRFGIGNGLDTGWVLGYLLMALGAMWSIRQRRVADRASAAAAAWTGTTSVLTSAGRGLLLVREPAVRTVEVKPLSLTPSVADRIVNSTGLLLILCDAVLIVYDAVVALRTMV